MPEFEHSSEMARLETNLTTSVSNTVKVALRATDDVFDHFRLDVLTQGRLKALFGVSCIISSSSAKFTLNQMLLALDGAATALESIKAAFPAHLISIPEESMTIHPGNMRVHRDEDDGDDDEDAEYAATIACRVMFDLDLTGNYRVIPIPTTDVRHNGSLVASAAEIQRYIQNYSRDHRFVNEHGSFNEHAFRTLVRSLKNQHGASWCGTESERIEHRASLERDRERRRAQQERAQWDAESSRIARRWHNPGYEEEEQDDEESDGMSRLAREEATTNIDRNTFANNMLRRISRISR